MINKISIKPNKKQYFIIHSLIITIIIYYFSLNIQDRGLWYMIIILILITGGFFITHRPNIKILDILVTSIPSILLSLGFFLSYLYFPNLSKYFKIFSALIFFVLFYLINLVNNVFLVVHARKEMIPLYRVAQTWSKILLAFIGIPLLAGIFKVPLIPAFEAFAASIISTLFSIYFVWTSQYNPDVKKIKRGEMLSLQAFSAFIVGCVTIGVSFFPNESFLRALFVASILIFCLTYLEGHLKNSINKKIIFEHFVISSLFLILLFIYNP
ncbi:hypothetical protein A2V49_03525 [candidate division WWE3 bacterium RBG_19FT_COMBO_34_6]|uniref:Uncharacterized protein n=1 Tax=candidate division WWE3 bacterium RBG_19FT_COMBO_34_6 TaxID=1802612 RepID=A0A1F4UMB7_UNCKA|nr:MAG: hypothetical protein A2V49_03525 [candidate division WWE3 bacterium RBG_19FT_COMBO_34_6]